MNQKRVGILRGGAGKHYNSSLKKGGEIISHITENLSDKYKVFDILVDREGNWHLNGVPILPSFLFHKVDIVWNTSHPSFSNILESFSIPNIGVGAFVSALENNKNFLREHVKNLPAGRQGVGIQMPRQIVSPKNAREVFEKFGSPWVVKFFTENSNTNIQMAKTFPELADAIEEGVKHSQNILVEEFIAGEIATVHSMPMFRGEDIYIFPLRNSYGNFSVLEKEKLSNLVKNLHKHLGAKHYLKSNFVLTPRGKVYLLEIELTPDLKPESHFSQVVESVGAKMHQIVEHILENV